MGTKISVGTNISFYLAKPFTGQGESGANLDPNMLPITIGEFNGGYMSDEGTGASFVDNDGNLQSEWQEYLNVFVVDQVGSTTTSSLVGASDQLAGGLQEPRVGKGVTVRAGAFGGENGACGVFDRDIVNAIRTNFDDAMDYPSGIDLYFTEGTALAHEIGHYLGLEHTFRGPCLDESEFVYKSVPTQVCDTPTQRSDRPTTCSHGDCNPANNYVHKANVMNLVGDVFSLDQACVMNYVANDLYGQLNYQPFTPDDLTELIIDTDVVWERSKVVNRNVVVQNGSTLTIRGETNNEGENSTIVYFAEEKKLHVERGAELIIDGATLTSTCFWKGITVYGFEGNDHPDSVSEGGNTNGNGIVFMKNNATIKNALAGITNYPPNAYDNFNLWEFRNGIVNINNAKFENNQCAVVLTENHAQTVSEINDTEFIVNDDYILYERDPRVQVSLKNVTGLEMKHLTFDHQATLFRSGVGFESNESTFAFKDENLDDDKFTSFTNYNTSIHSQNSGSQYQLAQTLVEGVTFNNTINAITFTGYTANIDDGVSGNNSNRNDVGLLIKSNILNLATQDHPILDLDSKWGICVEACEDYVINDNIINGGFVSGDGNNWFNAIVAKSSEAAIAEKFNYIQNNTIEGNGNAQMMNGVYAYMGNPSLQILCNSFTDNSTIYNINLNPESSQPASVLQGNCNPLDDNADTPEVAPAGNSFDPLSTVHLNNEDTANDVFKVDYHYALNNPNPPDYDVDNPDNDKVWGDFGIIRCGETVSQPDCSAYENGAKTVIEEDDEDDNGGTTGGGNCCSFPGIMSIIVDTEAEIQQAMNLLTAYNRLDRSGMITVAKTVERVQHIISDFDAYLSDDELKAVASKFGNNALAGAVLSILEKNSPLNNSTLQVLTDHINSLSFKERFLLARTYQNEIDQLYDNTMGSSPRTVKAAEIYQLGLDQKYVEPSLSCCRTTPQTAFDALQFAIDNTSINKSFFQKKLVTIAKEYGNSKLANITLSSIDTNNDEALEDYVALQQFYFGMQQFGKTLDDLSEEEIAVLESIANSHTLSGIQARNAVASIKDSLAVIHIPLTKLPTAKKAVKPVNPLKSIQGLKEKPVVYPNPAKDLLYLNLVNVTELPEHLKIKVYNSNGILVHQVKQKAALLNELNVSHFVQGTYFIEVLNEQYQLINRSKIILIK